MSIGPGSQSSLREANTIRVVETVRKYGHITQVELTAATGLSQASISNIVKRLVAEGILKTENTIRSGRRAQLVSLRRQSGLIAGVYVGRRSLSVAVADLSLEILAQKVLPLPVEHRPDTTLDRSALLVVELLEGVGGSVDELLSVGIAIAAPVDPESGHVLIRALFPGWEGIDIRAVLSQRLNRPVALENDANAGALAECRLGSLRGIEHGLFVRASYNTGAGIVHDGALYSGHRGTVGEIGHVQVDPNGLICMCGARGCLNTVVGADVLVESLRLSRGYSSLSDVIREANAGDRGCCQVIADAGANIGRVLADYATMSNPSRIAVGGELATTGDLLLNPIRDVLLSRPLLGNSIEVVPSVLGKNAEVMGALILALETSENAGFNGGLVTQTLQVQEVSESDSQLALAVNGTSQQKRGSVL